MTANSLSSTSVHATAPTGWRRLVLGAFSAIQRGTLTLEDPLGTHTLGQGLPHARLTVHDVGVYRRLALGGSVAAGEAYMEGHWDCDDLVALTRVLVANRDALEKLDGANTILSKLYNGLLHLTRRNSVSGSRRNISAHYDLSNDFFETFLDEQMMYSSAVFESSSATLEEASRAKLLRLCLKLELTPNDHLLEIGTGWGGLAVFAATHFGCRVTTTTISQQQRQTALRKVEEAGLQDRVTVLLADYRDLHGKFDKLVSVEMVEAVGHQYLDDYFAVLDRLVQPKGLIVLQAITIADRYYAAAVKSVDFIKKHIFPGSFIPSVSRLVDAAALQTDAVLVNLEDLGLDYARTLREWRLRVESRRDDIVALGFDETFLRMWRFYLAYCEGGFLERSISDVQMVFAKPDYRGRPWRGDRAGC